MSLTRNKVREILSTAGVDGDHMDAAVQAIIDGHTATVESLKEERDTAKEQAKKAASLQEEVDELKKTSAGGEAYKEKYDTLKGEFDKYKADQTAKATTAKKQEAYKALLKDAGVDSKRFDSILRVTDLKDAELDENGKFKDADKISEGIKSNWSDFIVSQGAEGARTTNPPSNNGGSMSKEDILNIKDTTERQAAIAENHEMFGF